MRIEDGLDFSGKRILITGGTGSLGRALVKRLLSMGDRSPSKIIIFSRDEAKQHYMRLDYLQKREATDEVIYNNFKRSVEFRIGDVRDIKAVSSAIYNVHTIIHAAALKQVPSCEYFPIEAINTNVLGSINIIEAIRSKGSNHTIQKVIGISTDKACMPVNSYGMAKSLMERIFVSANIDHLGASFSLVRYGNVLASRGSVIPLFKDQINNGGPVTITHEEMTRFFFSLDDAVDVVFKGYMCAYPGEIIVPKLPSFTILNIAKAMVSRLNEKVKIEVTGLRPGEKLHETLISDVEAPFSFDTKDNYYVITPMLPELSNRLISEKLSSPYTSKDLVLDIQETLNLLERNNLL
jgi:FlaA1/EpsC-like NDP-sugar epimerase